MKYLISIETSQMVEIESETAEAAIEVAKSKLDPRIAASALFQVVREIDYDEETKTYKIKE